MLSLLFSLLLLIKSKKMLPPSLSALGVTVMAISNSKNLGVINREIPESMVQIMIYKKYISHPTPQ